MEFRQYRSIVGSLPIGKNLPDAVYLHETALGEVPLELAAHLARAVAQLGLDKKDWNVVKFYKRDHKITLLHYPGFFDDPYPALNRAYTIDLEKRMFRETDYKHSDNPPILHRKETFLKRDHPSIPVFQTITEQAERIGLYKNPRTIGFKKSWERLISHKGYVLDEQGRLKPKAALEPVRTNAQALNGNVRVERHLTAIDRNKLSAPMQALARHNYLNGDYSVLDYGCGKGDDVRELKAHGLDVAFWDPVYHSKNRKRHAEIVNLGYVINVIDDRQERDEVLRDAFEHAEKVLAISAMLAGDSTIGQFTPYKDGVLTKRKTFQKYYTQSELRSYIETTLNVNAVAVSPGVFFVFKDELQEQTFLSERQFARRQWAQLTQRERATPKTSVKTETLFERHQGLFEDFWRVCLDLGRIPANSEFEFSDRLRAITGSHAKAFQYVAKQYGIDFFENAQKTHKDDLTVYFALGLFGKRKPYSHMPASLQRDVKTFFGAYEDAVNEATRLLFSVGKPKNITSACEDAYKRLGCGLLEREHSLTIHCSLVNQLPSILRVYIGCATQLYGDVEGFDLIKIHVTSGKISLMKYDDFEGKPLPELIQRVKINLRKQEIDIFDYVGPYAPHPLYLKSRLIPKTFSNYEKQVTFDRTLSTFGHFDLTGFGPSRTEFYSTLSRLALRVQNFDLIPAEVLIEPLR
jgi:DNA phosphorothioation-associated putative methyltransferase